MNRLPLARRTQIVAALVEGNSIRSIERMTGTHRDTIMRLMVDVGAGCAKIHHTEMRGGRGEPPMVHGRTCGPNVELARRPPVTGALFEPASKYPQASWQRHMTLLLLIFQCQLQIFAGRIRR